MRSSLLSRLFPVLWTVLMPGMASADEPGVDRDGLEACAAVVIADASPRVTSALMTIKGTPRRLLALRSYLRAGDVEERWSWTDEEIAAYTQSPAHAQAMEALERVKARFAAAYPGYELYVNTQVRSLDIQLARWNSNASVAVAATALADAAGTACADAPEHFAGWLKGWRPDPPPNLAAPGLSPHGQARAFDFQVMRDGAVVAGTDSRRIDADWVAGGWAERLAGLMQTEADFRGPLIHPREPWHYAYVPSSAD